MFPSFPRSIDGSCDLHLGLGDAPRLRLPQDYDTFSRRESYSKQKRVSFLQDRIIVVPSCVMTSDLCGDVIWPDGVTKFDSLT